MDGIEVARQVAEQLHNELALSGVDASNPLEFVLAELDNRDIEVFPADKGSAQLKGGRAIFDSQAGLILYEDCGTSFEKAFLLAHELGHIVLEGYDEDFIAENVDYLRGCETSPAVVDQVLDYGSRERKEVTMDVFAREFLLPRSLVCKWYIKENSTSDNIASKTGVPISVVQQQLLDALLLPPATEAQEMADKKTYEPDLSQKRAAMYSGSPYQLQAGPGTGKTSTLVRRVLHLLEHGVEPSEIFVLTFSNKAANELRERISDKASDAAALLWIGTFHAFGLDIVHRFHQILGLSENPTVVSRYEAIEWLEGELARLKLKHYRNYYDPTLTLSDILSAISRAKDEVVDAASYTALSKAMLEKAQDDQELAQAEKCLEVSSVYQCYERLLKERDAVDFGDLVKLPVELVESNEDVRSALSKRHKHILVDEYQDVNRASVRLIKAIAETGENLWVVGDSRQSIYRFRGASSTNMKRFAEDFPGSKSEQLAINYRSAGEIVDLFSAFSKKMQASDGVLPLNLKAHKGQIGILPVFTTAGKPDDELSAVATGIAEMRNKGFSYSQQTVLCTSNARLDDIAAYLEAQGVPVLYLGSLFERPEVRDLLSILSLLSDSRAQGLLRAARACGAEISSNDIKAIAQYIKENNLKSLDWAEHINKIEELSDKGTKSLQSVTSLLSGFTSQDYPWSVLATIVLDRLKLGKTIYSSNHLSDRMKGIAIWQLLNFSKNVIKGKGVPVERLLRRIRRIVQLSEDRDVRQLPAVASRLDGVRLLTIHASKGLEFDIVHLPGMVSTGLPGSNRPPNCIPPDSLIEGTVGLSGKEAVKLGHDEEEECKFFVATSRAKKHLLLYASSLQNNDRRRSPSKFIEEIMAYIRKSKHNEFAEITANAEKTVSESDKQIQLTASDLELYERCPRRYFYTRHLNLGGRQVDNAYMQMHNVVHDVLGWLKSDFSDSTPSATKLFDKYNSSWDVNGPTDNAYAEDYKQIGKRLLEYLWETRQNKSLITPVEIKVPFPGGTVTITPDEVTVDEVGVHRVRKIKSGKQLSTEFDQVGYTLLIKAAEQQYGKGTIVEAIHLAGETHQSVSVTDKKQATRITNCQNAISAISNGEFPAFPSARSCPTCPSFFLCGGVPS